MIAVGGEEGQLGTGRRLHPPDDEPHRRGVGLSPEGSVGGLGHRGGAVQPVGYRRPGIFGYGLDEIAQAFVLADGDGKAEIRLSAGGHHGVGVAAAVGAHGELPAGPAVAHPAHRLPQEVGGAASRVGSALAQPRHQHVAGTGPSSPGPGQQRVIAPLAGVAVAARPFLDQTIGLADGGVQVNGQGRVARSGPSRPGPGQQLPAHPVQLADMSPPETAQERPQGGWRLDRAAQGAGGPAGAQRVGVVNAVAASQGGGHQGHDLSAGVGSAWCIAQVQAPVNQFGKTQVQGQRGGQDQPSIGHQTVVVEGDLIRSGSLRGSI